jgi:hypothetical protein
MGCWIFEPQISGCALKFIVVARQKAKGKRKETFSDFTFCNVPRFFYANLLNWRCVIGGAKKNSEKVLLKFVGWGILI